MLVTCALLVVGLALRDSASSYVFDILAYSAVAISTVGVAIEFYRGRDYYVDSRLRAKALDLQES